jgi:hypothetical protein
MRKERAVSSSSVGIGRPFGRWPLFLYYTKRVFVVICRSRFDMSSPGAITMVKAIKDDDHDQLAAAEIALLAGAPTRRSVL